MNNHTKHIDDCHRDGVVRLHRDGVAQIYRDGVAQIYRDGVAQIYRDGVARLHRDGVAQIYSDGVAEIYSDGVVQIYSDGVIRIRKFFSPNTPAASEQVCGRCEPSDASTSDGETVLNSQLDHTDYPHLGLQLVYRGAYTPINGQKRTACNAAVAVTPRA